METPFKFKYFHGYNSIKLRYGYTKIKNPRGIILLLQGRAEFIEKYSGIANSLNFKGYDVLSLDWRGQGLSEREIDDRHKGYVKNFNYYLYDLEIFYHKILVSYPHDIFLLSHSMGGHIALRFLQEKTHSIKKAVFASPLFGIKTLLFPELLTRNLSYRACTNGFGKNYTPGGQKYKATRFNTKSSILSHDFEQLSIQVNEMKKNPELYTGGVTWGWLHAAFESIDIIMKEDYGSTIKIPVSIVNAAKDKLVTKNSQKKISRQIPNSSFISIPDSFHEIMFEKKEIRDLFWENFYKFIKIS